MKSFSEALSANAKYRHKLTAMSVKPGDILDVNPYWNMTSGAGLKIRSPTEILDVDKVSRGCQTGVLLRVACTNGEHRWLDAGWFEL